MLMVLRGCALSALSNTANTHTSTIDGVDEVSWWDKTLGLRLWLRVRVGAWGLGLGVMLGIWVRFKVRVGSGLGLGLAKNDLRVCAVFTCYPGLCNYGVFSLYILDYNTAFIILILQLGKWAIINSKQNKITFTFL